MSSSSEDPSSSDSDSLMPPPKVVSRNYTSSSSEDPSSSDSNSVMPPKVNSVIPPKVVPVPRINVDNIFFDYEDTSSSDSEYVIPPRVVPRINVDNEDTSSSDSDSDIPLKVVSRIPPKVVSRNDIGYTSSDSFLVTSSDSDSDIPPRPKRMKSGRETTNENEDRISALPDPLLIRILSLLGCTKEAVRTCLLSKRWEFLWTDLNSVILRKEGRTKLRAFVDWVGRMISMCKILNRFEVGFLYDKRYAPNVKHWVYFIIKNKVKDITFAFTPSTSLKPTCELPQMFYSYSSLTNLSLRYCVIAPLGTIAWSSLEHLKIERVELLDSVMENILSNCPVLRCVSLYSCWGLNYLNIQSPNLTTLVIHHRHKNILHISAPYLLVLSISNAEGTGAFKLTNVSSVVRANIDLLYMKLYMKSAAGDISTLNNVKLLLESFKSVETLELGQDCMQDVSMLEIKSRELPLYSDLACLTLKVSSHKMSIPGILAILRSSPKLETLHIIGCGTSDLKKTILDQYLIHLKDCNMDLVASHLKTVEITGFKEQDLAAEHMLTLLRILLKCSKVLEKMVISVKDPSSSISIESMKIAKRLLTFPRASPEGVVVFC